MTELSVNRRDLIKIAGAGAVVAAGIGEVVGVAAQASTPVPSTTASGELIIGKAAEAVGYDPAIVTATSSMELLNLTYNTLIKFDDAGQPIPELAESWEQPDELTWVFTLREGASFHNGQPVTAGDVKYTFDRILDPATESTWVTQFEPVASIEATDDRTVTFKLKSAYGPFLAVLTSVYSSILPNATTAIDFATTMVGSGAFAQGEIQPDTQTTLLANGAYWEPETPKLAQLTYKILPDEAGRLAAVRTGDIHLTTLADPLNVDAARSSDGVVVIEQETTDYFLLGFNCAQAPFDNASVRKALSLAIDRQAIVDAVFFGKGQVTGPIVPTLGDWALPIDQLPNYTPDLDQARQLLADAGASDLSFKILLGSLYPEFNNIALVIQDQLKEIGVTVELEPVEWATFIDRWRARDFQSFVSFNGSGNDPDRALYPAIYTGGSVNAFQFSDPAIDALLDTGRTTSDPAARKETYGQVETAIAEAAPAIFLNTRVANFATRDNVSGFAPSPSQTWLTLKQTTIS